MASRKRRGLPPRERAPKTKATPKRTPHSLTREAYTERMGRRARRELVGESILDRALGMVRGAKQEERAHLERILRESGGVDLG